MGVVTHWGVIKALTGRIVPNGTVLRYDPIAAEMVQAVPVD